VGRVIALCFFGVLVVVCFHDLFSINCLCVCVAGCSVKQRTAQCKRKHQTKAERSS